MMLIDLKCGDWFTSSGGHYMRVEPFQEGEATFHAICLESGRPAYPSRTPGTTAPLPLEAEVIKLTKPPEWRFHRDR